jgi:hypothetical protein
MSERNKRKEECNQEKEIRIEGCKITEINKH